MEEELKRLRKIIVRTGMILVVLIALIVSYFSLQLKEVNRSMQIAQARLNSVEQPVKGLDGVDGKDGEKGLDGVNGTPGQNAVSTNTTTNTVVEKSITTQIPVPGPPGEQGPQGLPGTSGREIALGTKAGKVVWKYVGDTDWQEITDILEVAP